ncbi:AAA family ATPase [Microbispora rosea]|uniref:ATP-binding protein n=1 Tax=Microbispora rosea TaxID=58117 RepID=UPI003435E46D
MVLRVADELKKVNATHPGDFRIVLAFDLEPASASEAGVPGSAPAAPAWLARSSAVREFGGDVVTVLSDRLYREVFAHTAAEGRVLHGFRPLPLGRGEDGWVHTGGAVSRPDGDALFAAFRKRMTNVIDGEPRIYRFLERDLIPRRELTAHLPAKTAFAEAAALGSFRELTFFDVRPDEQAEHGRAVVATWSPKVFLGLIGPLAIFAVTLWSIGGLWGWLAAPLITTLIALTVAIARAIGPSRRGGSYFFYLGFLAYVAVQVAGPPSAVDASGFWIFLAAALTTHFLFPFFADFAAPCLRYLRSVLRTAGGRQKRKALLNVWLAQAQEYAIVPVLIKEINSILGDAVDVLLVEHDTAGLRSLTPDAFVDTHSLRAVDAVLKRSASSSIAIAGPRGIGKSTLIDRLAERHAEQGGFALKVSAPAGYVPKEFLVHLFQQLCEQAVPQQFARGVSRRPRGVVAARLTALALTALLVWSFATELPLGKMLEWGQEWWEHRRLLLQVALLPIALALWFLPRSGRESTLAVLARRDLDHLRYETTITSGAEVSAAQAKLSGSWARKNNPWTMPQLVDRLREFLAAIAKDERVVLIGIDEVDRIGDVAQAEQFISEIKAVFRVPDCHFVVSVAEEVGSLFARRAIVGRSIFENAFDEIVIVEPLRISEAAQFLQLRVPGFTQPFVHLAYALSGGLPRELLRVTCRLIEVNAEGRPQPKLPELARLLVREEVHEAIEGTRLRLAQLSHDTDGELLSELRRRLGAFTPQADLAELPSGLRILAGLTVPAGQAGPTGQAGPAAAVLAGLAAFADFGLAVVEAFDRFALQPVPASTSDPLQYVLLAEARRELSLSPAACRSLLGDIRSDLGPGPHTMWEPDAG